MRYVICNAEKASQAGMSLVGRLRTKDRKKVLLNESSVMNCQRLDGTLEERVTAIDGMVMTDADAMKVAKDLKM